MAEDEQLIRTEGGAVYLRPSIALTAYFLGRLPQHVEGVRHFYREAVERLGPRVQFYQTESMRKPRPIKDRSPAGLGSLLHVSAKLPPVYKLFLESDDAAKVAPRASVTVFASMLTGGGAVRLALPVEDVLGREPGFVDDVRALVEELAFDSGYGGYSFNRADESELQGRGLAESTALSHRWQGIDVESLSTTLYAIPSGLKAVGWLTLLGERMLARAGGLEALRAGLPTEVLVHPLRGGVMIQAGPRPLLGDVNRREDLGLYRAVGRALAAVRSRNHPPYLYASPVEGEDHGWTATWLARFDS